MLIPENGVHQTSERYFFTPSSLARELFYYPTRCGHYFCNSLYSFSHQSEIARQGDHNQNIMLFLIQAGAMELTLNGTPTLATAGQTVIFDCREPYRYTRNRAPAGRTAERLRGGRASERSRPLAADPPPALPAAAR